MKMLVKFTIAMFCAASLTACSSIAKLGPKKAKADDTPTVDITRPPQMVVNTKDDAIERDPDETVSFDKWQKETQGEDEDE